MARLRKVIDKSLFSGTGVDMRPGNASHTKLLPAGTTASSGSPTATSDYHFVRLRNRVQKLYLQCAGKIATVSGLSAAGGTDDVEWNVPIFVQGFAVPHVDESVDYWSTFWPVHHTIDFLNAKLLQYGSSLLVGLGSVNVAGTQPHHSASLGHMHSSSQPPRIFPGVGWGTADATGGETNDMPAVGDRFGGYMQVGLIETGPVPNVEATHAHPRPGGLDARGIDGLWLFMKAVWPANTVVAYSTPTYTVDLDIRLIGLGE